MSLNHSFLLTSRGMAFAGVMACSAASFALTYDVQRAATAPTIDGNVDAVWSTASPAATNFVVHTAVGTQADQQTSVRMLWDTEKLYILFEAQDSEIVAPMTGDHVGFDFATPQDTAEIFLDPQIRQTTAGNDYLYHIMVNPGPGAYLYSEAGQNQTNWKPRDNSEFAFSSSGTNWTIEMAIAWSDLNSTETMSPGVVQGPPPSGAIWGAQLGRLHSPGSNAVASKWEPTAGAFRTRPFGFIRFVGPPNNPGPDLSGKVEVFRTGFEAPLYTAGETVVGIEEHGSSFPNLFQASTEQVVSGNQSLKITASANGRTLTNIQRTTNTTTAQYLQYALWMPSERGNNYRHVVYLNAQYTDSVDRLGQVWFYGRNDTGANRTTVVTYADEITTTSTVVSIPGVQAFDEWMYVTIKMDPVTDTFEVWLNDLQLRNTDGSHSFLVKRGPEFVQFLSPTFYSKAYGTQPVFMDNVLIAEDPQDAGISDWQLF